MTHRHPTAGNADVVDRLARLRTILPLIATDLAAARRRANTLETENRQLSRRVAELESKLNSAAASPDLHGDAHADAPAQLTGHLRAPLHG